MKMSENSRNEQMDTLRDSVESGLNNAVRTFQKATDQFTKAVGFTGPQAEELARRSSQNVDAVTQASALLVKGSQEISHEWMRVVHERMSKNLDAFSKLAGCRSLQDFIAVQSDLARDRLGHTVESTRRLSEVSARVASEAAGIIQQQAGRNSAAMEGSIPFRAAS
jgi:phasin family protein